MTEVYLSGAFSIESEVEVADDELDALYQALSGSPIQVEIPVGIAEQLGVTILHFDSIDEVEVLN